MRSESLIAPPASQRLKAGRVNLDPGESVDRHVAEGREELIVVLRGSVTVKERTDVNLTAGMAHFIGEGVAHDVVNDSDQESEYMYVVAPVR